MKYQILEQAAPGEKWEFIAHGARYSKTEAEAVASRASDSGVRRRIIACGRERKRTGAAALVLNTTRGVYWRTPAGLYVAAGAHVGAEEIGRRVGGYARLDSLMRLRGERPDLIAAHCTADGHAKESAK